MYSNNTANSCQYQDAGAPVFLTKNGRGRYVIVDIQDYEKTRATLKLIDELAKGKNMVLYRINGYNIYVDRVLYGRRDYLRILFPDLPQ